MNFPVPQFIDVKDKIAFGLNGAQLGMFIVGGIIAVAGWKLLDGGWPGFIVGAIALGCSAAFSFIKISGMTFANFLLRGIYYFFTPKKVVWEKQVKAEEEKKVIRKREGDKKTINRFMKEKRLKEIEELAKGLDTK